MGEILWGLRTCPIDCSLPSTKETQAVPYEHAAGPGVVAGFVITAGVTVFSAAATYLSRSDSHNGIHHEQENVVDEIVLGSTRRMGRLTAAYAESLIPSGISSRLALILRQSRTRRVFSNSLLAMSDIQILTGLAILIRGSAALCPTPTQPNGVFAYHWQVLVNLAWFSTITNQGALFFMRKYFREHPWHRNVRLLLMCTQLVFLMIAMVPTASFNWYSIRAFAQQTGPSDRMGFVPDNWLVAYPMLAKSAALPISPALCYFEVSRANDLYRSADPCRWGNIIPIRPPQLTSTAAYILRRVIADENVNLFGTIGDREGVGSPSISSLELDSRREQYCDLHTPLPRTDAFQAATLGILSLVILFLWNALRLFGFPPSFFRRRIRSPTSRYSRRAIEKITRLATQKLPATGHRPDLAEGVVKTPLLALHLAGRLMLDMLTSKLAKVLLLTFAFVQGSITLYPALDPYFHRIPRELWTFNQVLAVLFPLSPLLLVVLELSNAGIRAWRASSNQPEYATNATAITKTDTPTNDRSINVSATNDRHIEAVLTGLDAKQIQNAAEKAEQSVRSDGTTSILDSPEYRSSKWMSIAVWLLVTTVTLLASAQLIYAYIGWSALERLPILIPVAVATIPASCYAWALTGLHIRSETAHYASGYRHGSRFIKWTTKPSASQLMMLTAAFAPLGVFMLTLVDVLASRSPLPQGTPGRYWVLYLFHGSYWAMVVYFSETVYVNFIMWYFNRSTPEGTSGVDLGRSPEHSEQ